MTRTQAIAGTIGVPVFSYSPFLRAFDVALAIDRFVERLPARAVMRTLNKVELYESLDPDGPWQFRKAQPDCALYQPWDRFLKICSQSYNEALLAHELGHHIDVQKAERFAEGIKQLYGPPGQPEPPGLALFMSWLLDA